MNNPFTDFRGELRCIYDDTYDDYKITQVNLSTTWERGTVRGMHYQPGLGKIVRCVQGAIYDVMIDLRPESYGRQTSAYLSVENQRAVVVPAGFAHGFQVLKAPATVLYFLSTPYDSKTEKGIHYEVVRWPISPINLSERDMTFPGLGLPPCRNT